MSPTHVSLNHSAGTKIKEKKEKTKKKIKINRSRDVGDITFDLIKVFEQKDIGKMSDEELEEKITNLQKMRMMRFTTSKRKTPLDKILEAIDLQHARSIKMQFEENERKNKGIGGL